MSIVLKIAVCHVLPLDGPLALMGVYIEFAWNYASLNSNYYYFMKTTHLLKPQSYACKLQKS